MDGKDNGLGISWHDSACIPNLNPGNIMDYFSEKSNPFYDRTCNNEVVKMQRLNLEQLNNMTGLEYILLHCQEPILYVVRKQHRHSPSQVTPLSDYYIIAGIVYQAPDLGSVINSRILSAVHHIQGAFEKTQSYSRYQPSKGYWWDFKEQEGFDTKKKIKDSSKEEPSSIFQRQRVDILLAELIKKYPLKIITVAPAAPVPQTADKPQEQLTDEQLVKVQSTDAKVEVKQEKNSETTVIAGSTVTSHPMPSQLGITVKSTTKQPSEKRPRLA